MTGTARPELLWTASLVHPVDDRSGAPLLRREVALEDGHGPVTSAVWHVSAQGVFEAAISGTPVSDDLLSPGWTTYPRRLRYRSYDVAHLLADTVVLGLRLGNGWWRGRLGWLGSREVYGDRLGAISQLEVTFADGHVQQVGTDATWRSRPSEVLADDLYDGQTVDFRLREDSWWQAGADVSGWQPVEVGELDTSTLEPYLGPPVRRQEVLRPQRIWSSPSGRTLVDVGQNMVGFLRFAVRGERGAEITLRHAEVLEDGELGVRPLRSALATDRLVLSGGDDAFEPTFTFHGFRYAEVTGWPGELTVDDLEAVVVHSDLRRTGTFRCSEPLLDQLHRNVVWGFRGNAVDLPTDCPQRDERLGWTGDLAVFAPTAAFLFDVGPFLRDWLRDVAAEQELCGVVPFVVPDLLGHLARTRPGVQEALPIPLDSPTAVWGDAGVWVPWTLWQAYGDLELLREHYDAMAAHVDSAAARLSPTGLWDTGWQFGDWLDPVAPPDAPWQAKASSAVVATACLHRSADIAAQAAQLLGRAEDAARFQQLADSVRSAFRAHYLHEDGTIESDAVTVYALAIVFGLLDDDEATTAGRRLAELVREAGHHITTGFAGTPFVCDALTVTGHLDDAYALLLQQESPSWLYQVRMGATTVWERWDSMLPDGSINPGGMTSFNHYAFGAVADWLHRTVGGLSPLEPGYRRVRVAPRPGGGLTWAETALDTPAGQVRVRWDVTDAGLVVDVELPAGVDGVLDLPGQPPVALSPGRTRT